MDNANPTNANPDYFLEEVRLTKKFFDMEETIRFQLKYDVQIIRGGDYQYVCYINKEGYSTALTPMFALVSGIKQFKEKNEHI